MRCNWANVGQLEQDYHDHEWGKVVHQDKLLFEMLVLESMQAGLSWSTILKKRTGFRQAFDGFDYQKIALYKEDKYKILLSMANILNITDKIEKGTHSEIKTIEVKNG